jgi:undecaprenyl-diphosphatase
VNDLQDLDRSVFLALNSLHLNSLDPIMVFFSGQVIWVPLILWSVWYAFKHLGRREAILFVTFLVITLIVSDSSSSYVMKNIFTRLRPCRLEELKPLIYQFGQKCGGRFGFISSHASNSVALVSFTLLSLKNLPRIKYVFILLAFIVGFSRIYLGVHYPGDVIVGFLNGGLWGLIFAKMYQGASRARSQPEEFFV